MPFQSTPSAWRETSAVSSAAVPVSPFQSTPSAWRETICGRICTMDVTPFQSTPSAWRETPPWLCRACILCHFNPLPPHGGRHNLATVRCPDGNFNPLPPHGGRPPCLIDLIRGIAFQSTPSAWRETVSSDFFQSRFHISIHSLRMEGDYEQVYYFRHLFQISIHSLRMEGDHNIFIRIRHPVGISIHSLRMEGDGFPEIHVPLPAYFNPLPPHGGRQTSVRKNRRKFNFNPLPPHGGRPVLMRNVRSIENFNPLPPHGGRLPFSAFPFPHPLISIHSLRMEGDSRLRQRTQRRF